MKRIIFLLSLSIFIVFNACKKKDETPSPSEMLCKNPSMDATGSSGMKVSYWGHSLTVQDYNTQSAGAPPLSINAPQGSQVELEFTFTAPQGYLRIEAAKKVNGETTSIAHSVSDKNTNRITVPFELGSAVTEITIVLIDHNCNAVTTSQKFTPYTKSEIYKSNKIYSQLAAAPKSRYYSLSQTAPYVSGGSLKTGDVQLVYSVDEKDNHKPYFMAPSDVLTPQTGSASYNALYVLGDVGSLEELTVADMFKKITFGTGVWQTKIEIEAGKIYFIRSGKIEGAIRVNSISGTNNEEVDFDYVLLKL